MSGAVIAAIIGVTAGSAVTPGTPNWPDITGAGAAITAQQQITGIDAPISLKITWTGVGVVAYSINGSAYTYLTSGGSFTVNNFDVVKFLVANPDTLSTKSGTVTVQNASDGDVVLDTFTYVVSRLFI
jgi:hypothetical protein